MSVCKVCAALGGMHKTWCTDTYRAQIAKRKAAENANAFSDHAAMNAINAVLDDWFKGETTEPQALTRIAQISGKNAALHAEAAEAQK